MAFTNTPLNETQRTVNIPFDQVGSYRSGDLASVKDAQVINAYYDRISQTNQERFNSFKKRPGLSTSGYSLSKSASSAVIRGYHYDASQNAFYWAVDNKVYQVKPDVSVATLVIQTLGTSSGQVAFCPFLKSDNTAYMFFSDGVSLWGLNTATMVVTQVTDPDLPSPHEPSIVYLNGYLAVIKKNTGDIYTCQNDDPFTWVSGDFITAEMSNDFLLKLARTKNYIVSFGQDSMEHFYDAGVATGSPLQRYDSAFTNVGYLTGLAQIKDTLFFVGHAANQRVAVYALDSFEVKKISTEIVERSLEPFLTTDNIKGRASLDAQGHSIAIDGHLFYLIRLSNTSWVFDMTENLWYEWRAPDNSGLGVEAVFNARNGGCYMAVKGQTVLSNFSTAVGTDFGVKFSESYVTPSLHFGSMAAKFMSKLSVVCDQPGNSGNSGTDLEISWSDDDGLSFNTPRSVNVFSDFPTLYRLGRFRKRMFKFTYTGTTPAFRMFRAEAEINIGTG